jgi:hypothetical protein
MEEREAQKRYQLKEEEGVFIGGKNLAVGSSPPASSAVSPAAPASGPDGPAARRTDPAPRRNADQNSSPAAP